MADVLAEFAMNEQLTVVEQNINLDNATRYTLQQKKIKGNDFVESYKYYTASGEIEKILDKAKATPAKKTADTKKTTATKSIVKTYTE